jgi:GTP cyclohydrolase I
MDDHLIIEGVEHILMGVGKDIARDGLLDTPDRVVRMYNELCWSPEKREEEVKKSLGKVFPTKYGGMIVSKGIRVYSMCEHHILPIQLDVVIGYIPDRMVIGISKLTRVVEILAKRLMIQEDYTEEIVDVVMEVLKPQGVGVYVEGLHFCQSMRGVKQRDAIMVTTSLKGCFLENDSVKQEFLSRVK